MEIRGLALVLSRRGLSARAVTKRLQQLRGTYVSPQTVARWARGAGINRHRGGPRIIELPLNFMQQYESDMTATELARRYGVSGSTILKRLREAGARIRSGNSLFAHRMTQESLRAMWFQKGCTARRIADESGCSLGTVYRLLKLHGLRNRTRAPRRTI